MGLLARTAEATGARPELGKRVPSKPRESWKRALPPCEVSNTRGHDMNLNWKALAPHVPLQPGADEYVSRPDSAGDEIANWILADRWPVLVGGPTGVGKSTELARAARLLQKDRVACLVPLDRFENMRRITADQLLLRIAGRVAFLAKENFHLQLSSELLSALAQADVLSGIENEVKGSYEATPAALARLALTEVARRAAQGRVTLLLDGLEKVPQGPGSLELFDALGELPEEVEIVTVVPWHAAFGPQAETIVRPGERFVALRALDVEGEAGFAAREFLREVLLQRLHLPGEALDPTAVIQAFSRSLAEERALVAAKRNIVMDAVHLSGGLPRMFLQLMADAATYARLRRGGDWPIVEDLNDACADQADTLRRLLLPGDAAAIRQAAQTDGRELGLERKVRLMAHGILLERMRNRKPELEIHPLARAAVEDA